MNFLSLIAREEPIGGMEISNTALRIAFLDPGNKKTPARFILETEPLPPGTIVDGKINNHEAFVSALKLLLKKFPLQIRYYIVSIPHGSGYTKIMTFPPALLGEHLKEAVRLALPFQLPWKEDESYVDFKHIDDKERNSVFLAAAQRKTITEYVDALQKADIKAIAVELSLQSLLRATTADAEPKITVLTEETSIILAIIRNGMLEFSRILPRDHVKDEEAVENEVRKVQNYYEAEYHTRPTLLPYEALTLNSAAAKLLPSGEAVREYFIAIGAALRGALPRSADRLMSLLPVSTETMYKQQKAMTFMAFLRNITMGVCVFFLAAYAGVWLLMSSIQENFSREVQTLSAPQVSDTLLDEEARARDFNEFILATGALAAQHVRWSTFLHTLKDEIPQGITISNLTLSLPEMPIQLSGVAQTRAQLNAFKKALEQKTDLKDVSLPLTNIAQKENIPFSMTFSLTDPTTLYLH